MKKTVAALFVCALTGCATTTGLAPTETKSGFSGARVVSISPHGNACTTMQCTAVGAQWDSSRPDAALLTIDSYGTEYAGITGAKLAINGREVDLKRNSGLSRLSNIGTMRVSSHDFTVQLSLVREVAAAQRAWLRVYTTKGYVEHAIIDGVTDSKAYHALKRFLSQVDGGKS